jgi:DNA repair photolyase
MSICFEEIAVRKLVNVHRHVDGPWAWDKYSAHPYIGCRSGCEFCYARGGRYMGRRDPATFDKVIQVKVNAIDRLRRELPRLPPDVIACGDWQQPAEGRYGLSRAMLEVIAEFGFPLLIYERSPLVARDLDLLIDINRRAWVGVAFSLSSVDPAIKRAFEPRSPGVEQRLQAMEKLAAAGIRAGAALMPIIPLIGDDTVHLEDAIRAIRDHGGSFVMAGGLTMSGSQAERSLAAVCRFDPSMEPRWRQMYSWPEGGTPAYGPPGAYAARLGLMVRELCARHSILDRMPRYITPGPLAANKRIAERLFLRVYDLELEQASEQRLWAYRKAAWTVDEHPESIADLHRARGEASLQELPGIGKKIAAEIGAWLAEDV